MRQFRKNKIISQAGGEGGERVKNDGLVGVSIDNDLWNLRLLILFPSSSFHPASAVGVKMTKRSSKGLLRISAPQK